MSGIFEAIKIIISAILIVVLVIVVPSVKGSERHDEIAMNHAETSVRKFVDIVTSKGYIDPRDFNLLSRELSSSGLLYDIQMEYNKKRYQPLYTDSNDFYTFTESFEVLYDGYYSETILNRLFPRNTTLELDDPARRFNFKAGDLFKVTVTPLGKNMTSTIANSIGGFPNTVFPYQYGGMVSDEAP